MANHPDRDTLPHIRLRVRAALSPSHTETLVEPNKPVTERPTPTKGDYEVGYKKPPKHTRWKAGFCPNLKGRGKGVKNASTIAREQLERKVVVKIDGRSQKRSVLELSVQRQTKKAVEGDLKSLHALLAMASYDGAHSAGDRTGSNHGAQPSAEFVFTEADMAMLIHERREIMLAKGVEPATVDAIIEDMGMRIPDEGKLK